MSHRAPKRGNRLAADDVRTHAQPRPAQKRPAQNPKAKTKRVPTAPPPPANLTASEEILALFARTFADTLSRPDLAALLQGVKTHLFDRNYSAAFGRRENLAAYIVRWSPSRALCYRSVFLELCDELRDVFDVSASVGGREREVVCFGGGAGGEMVAAAAAVKALLPRGEEHEGLGRVHVTVVDVAGWGEVFGQLRDRIIGDEEEEERGYFAAADKGVFSADFHQADVLSTDLSALVPRATRLVSLLFTTNELYAQSRAATTKMLLGLAALVEKGCLLLVLESAGSYSTVKVGEKVFGMGMLLDHTLVDQGGDWEKVAEDEARWYRLPQAQVVNGNTIGPGLKYPLALENMRYFVRVFRKL